MHTVLKHGLRFLALGLLAFAACLPVVAVAQSAAPAVRIALIESLSGPFGNTGEAVFRNLVWATERVNARGGVKLPSGAQALRIERYDSKGQNEEALAALRSAIDDGIRVIAQGNSSATAAVLIDAINKHNEREPAKRVLFLNYSAVEPALTNEKCSFWHFRFDAHADMRMAALMDVLKDDKALKSIYLIGQDYSFGQSVLREARKQLAQQRPDVQIVGDELHPMARVKDFLPYAVKIKQSGAQAVLTGNFGNDLTLLVKAAKDAGFEGKFYTFYGNALGVPGVLAEAGVGKVIAVADWFPNTPGVESERFYQAFRQRYPKPQDDYVHMRMQLMVEALTQSMEKAGSLEAAAVARQLEKASVNVSGLAGAMRAGDHQFQQPLRVAVMDRQGAPGVKFDVEGSGFGFRVIKTISQTRAEQPHSCQMNRPS
jgi:branched-chain amino acid transport system substrate-binding protein